MDGAALIDALADWTKESHPNVSDERRKENNELMAEFRTELFSLLGNSFSAQSGGGNDGEITFHQEIDENLIRNMSAEELELQIGGGNDGPKLGFFKKFKIILGMRKFNDFVADFEKLRAVINKNLTGYEAELARAKSIIDNMVSTTKNIFLYKKVQTMWTIILKNDASALGPEKEQILNQRIKRVTLEIERLEITLKQNVLSAQKLFQVKGFFSSKFSNSAGVLKFQKKNFVDELLKKTSKQVEAYNKLYSEMNYYSAEIAQAQQYKLLEAAVAKTNASDLTKQQRKELAKYQKNRERYEKMFAFSETRRDEQEKLIARKENIVAQLAYFKKKLLDTSYLGNNKNNMQAELDKWDTNIRDVYNDLNDVIDKSDVYKKQLKELRDLVFDNGTQISKLISGMAEFQEIKKEYDVYLTNCDKVYETQELVNNTLNELKNKFIDIIPDKNLLPDMFSVVSAQSFLLSMVERVLAETQYKFGATQDRGRQFLENKVIQMRGGNNFNQKGGIYYSIADPAHIPDHGPAFYDHNDRGDVWDDSHVPPIYVKPTAAPGTNVQLKTLPYGVRAITEDYIKKLNTAIKTVNQNKHIFFPLLEYKEKKNIVKILVATYDVSAYDYRIVSVKDYKTKNFCGYNEIWKGYYFYNIMDDSSKFPDTKTDLETFLETNQIKLGGKDYVLLPVFYKIGTVTNRLFDYDEYVMLHPLLGGVLATVLKEDNFSRSTANTYDFDNKDISFRMILKTENINPLSYINEFAGCEYYYNFCGSVFRIKAPKGTERYFTTNHATGGKPDTGAAYINATLQPVVNIDMNNNINRKCFANFIFQLMGHMNKLATQIWGLNLEFLPSVQILNPFSTQVYDNPENFGFSYKFDTTSPESLSTQPDFKTKLDHIGTDKTYSNEYFDDLFTTSNEDELVWIFAGIKILLSNIFAYMTLKKLTPLNPTILSGLDSSILGATLAAAGLPGGIMPAQRVIGPREKKRLDFLNMAIGPDSAYWVNLTKISDSLKKFSATDFQDYNKKIFKIYDTMLYIRKFEDKILEIKFDADKLPLPELTLIAKELENKAPGASSHAYTNAGQKLYDKLKENSGYVERVAAMIGSSDMIRDLDDLLHEIIKINNRDLLTGAAALSFFATSPGDKYKLYLQTKDGATELVNQLKMSKNWSQEDRISKICHSLEIALGININTNPEAFAVYDPLSQRNKLLYNKNNNKNRRNNNRRSRRRGY